MRKYLGILVIFFASYISGCATVPMAPMEDDALHKEFSKPAEDYAGLYIYRNSHLGCALKKTISIDGEVIGETAPMTYFYHDISPGTHTISTESEFSDNSLTLDAKGGQNYFIRNYIRIGVFVGGANLELVSEEEGQKGVNECKLAK